MSGDLRVCFFGDSFVQGIGDPDYRGWVGRVLAVTGPDVTAFNLGVRRDTSDDVVRRYRQELDARTVADADNRLVVSFGSNDAIEENGRVRVELSRCVDNLAGMIAESRDRQLSMLVVGPPPVLDAGAAHLERTMKIAAEMAALCAVDDVPFVDITAALAADPAWIAEVTAGDGAHPGRGGYERLTALVLDAGWRAWLGGRAGRPAAR
ncbi:GDSL-type esterase/lipase family protein [Nocardia rhizosphaerae]|uniref:GDSL-type esterase/lipase family protein n=1 Tax=Nocardia rhizosphaerae TaxID=1691571 RepID=A0ABV8LBZ1_9NOCA